MPKKVENPSCHYFKRGPFFLCICHPAVIKEDLRKILRGIVVLFSMMQAPLTPIISLWVCLFLPLVAEFPPFLRSSKRKTENTQLHIRVWERECKVLEYLAGL